MGNFKYAEEFIYKSQPNKHAFDGQQPDKNALSPISSIKTKYVHDPIIYVLYLLQNTWWKSYKRI